MQRMIAFYNEQQKAYKEAKILNPQLTVENFVNSDAAKISWTVNLKKDIENGAVHSFLFNKTRISVYRPFTKQYLYFDRPFIERLGLSSMFFPNPKFRNIVICISPSLNDGLSLLISDTIANLHFNGDTQCFPLYYYEERQKNSPDLFDSIEENEYIRKDGISEFILERAKKQYGKNVNKEDIFYYVYGILHSPDYRIAFANALKKMLP